ncbi:hypothetical protein [Marinicauda salina]|nr:hypothetical protein [Marinicauda salina]
MIANIGPNPSVPTRRASRVERTARADSDADRRRGEQALVPAGARRDHPSSRRERPDASASTARTATTLQIEAGPPLRGLRADETERRRYRDAYASAAAGVAPAPRPAMETRA